MKIIVNRYLPLGSFKAFALLHFVFVREGTVLTRQDVQHEEIHWEQEKELLIVGFYLLYGLLFLWELVRCLFDRERGMRKKNGLFRRAYRSVAFEREAYVFENVQFYVKYRRSFEWARKKY